MKSKLALNGSVYVTGSKSILNRVLILAPFFKTSFRLENFSSSSDVETIVNNLQHLGMFISYEQNSIMTRPLEKFKDNASYFIKDSATALRFLLTRLSLIPGLRSTLDASEQLKDRPHHQLIAVLKQLGVKFQSEEFPLSFTGIRFAGGKLRIPANISSQFISAFLLCSHELSSDLEIEFSGDPVSLSYIDLTIKVLEQFGIKAERNGHNIFVAAGQKLIPPESYTVEPDISSACYFLALGAINQGDIAVKIPQKSIQPDFRFLQVLEKMGAEIIRKEGSTIVRYRDLKGVELDMTSMPDQVPTLACLALLADSSSKITGIDHLRYKESNRMQALLQEFPKLGAHISYSGQRLVVEPLKHDPPACQLHAYRDHRLVMAFKMLSLVFPQVKIDGEEVVAKSFPEFFETLAALH